MSVEQLRQAIENIPQVEGLQMEVKPGQDGSRGTDGILVLTYLKEQAKYRVQVRQDLTTTGVSLLVSRLSERERRDLLIYAPYINTTCANRLRQHGISFIDNTGHIFLRHGGLYLFVSGKEKGKERQGYPADRPGVPAARPFKTATLKLVYAMLTDPLLDASESSDALINNTYRDMRERTGLSLGSISNVLEDLIAGEFIVEVEAGQRILVNRRKLFERWVQDYGTRLRPKLVTMHYRPPRNNWWQNAEMLSWGGKWGGEVAGSKLTDYLKPETATIYTDHVPQQFIVQQDLRKDPVGLVEVLKPFWKEWNKSAEGDCVHPLIAYADLAASSIDRNLETAERIYERYLRSVVESA